MLAPPPPRHDPTGFGRVALPGGRIGPPRCRRDAAAPTLDARPVGGDDANRVRADRRCPLRRSGIALICLALCAGLLLAACARESDRPADDPGTTASRAPTAAAEPAPAGPAARDPLFASDGGRDEPAVVDLRIADGTERDRLAAALTGAGFALLPAAAPASDAGVVISAAPLPDEEALLLDAWAAVAHQRHDVLALSLDELRRVLDGHVDNWSALGGADRPIRLLVAREIAPRVRRILQLPDHVGYDVATATLADDVRSAPGALALVPLDALRPGLLPLIVDGYDPLRDPAARNPLGLRRWLRAPDAATRDAVLAALGWTPLPAADPLGLVATGDYIPARCVPDSVQRFGGGDFNAVFADVGEHLRAADVVVVSMEAPVVPQEHVSPCLRTLVLSAPVEAVDALAGAGVDVVTLAGNHAADCYAGCGRARAVRHTIEVLEAAGIAHAGTGPNLAAARRPALIERDGIRLAVLSYEGQADHYFASADTAGVAPLNKPTLREDVAAARAIADHVIVAFSSGAEYVQTTIRQQDEAVRVALEAGATLVVGNHPHAVQPLVEQGGALAAFALGNFVFDQDWSIETTQSVLLEVGFSADRIIGYRVRPVVIRLNYRPEFVDPAGDEGRDILTRLWDATDAWLDR